MLQNNYYKGLGVMEGIVEQYRKKMMRTSVITYVLCFTVGIPMFLFSIAALVTSLLQGFQNILALILLFLLSINALYFGRKLLLKTRDMKKDAGNYLEPIGTTDNADDVAAKFNLEYQERQTDPVLQKYGILYSDHYFFARSAKIQIALLSSILCVSYKNQNSERSVQNGHIIAFQVYCKSIPGKQISILTFNVTGKDYNHALQFFDRKHISVEEEKSDKAFYELAQADYPSFEKSCVSKYSRQ